MLSVGKHIFMSNFKVWHLCSSELIFHDQTVNEWTIKLSWNNRIFQLPCNRVKQKMFIFCKTNRTYLWRFHSKEHLFICFSNIRGWTFHLVCLSECFGVGCDGWDDCMSLAWDEDFHRILFSANQFLCLLRSWKSEETSAGVVEYGICLTSMDIFPITKPSSSSSSYCRVSVANAPNVLQPYWLIVQPWLRRSSSHR